MSSFVSTSYISETLNCGVGANLFPFCRLPFVLLTVTVALQKRLSAKRSHLFIVNLSICVTGILLWKLSLKTLCSKIIPTFSSFSFSVIGFMF